MEIRRGIALGRDFPALYPVSRRVKCDLYETEIEALIYRGADYSWEFLALHLEGSKRFY